MSLHFQVYADFSLANGKPQLASASISSVHAACTSWPVYPLEYALLTISRIFPTLQEAQDYAAYLYGVYPSHCKCASPAPQPVLDGGQKELFSEVSE